MVKMESETVLGDVTNLLNEEGEGETSKSPRVALVRINVKRSAYLDYHKEWSNGNSHIDPSTIFCLEGSCGDVLEKIDSLMYACFMNQRLETKTEQ